MPKAAGTSVTDALRRSIVACGEREIAAGGQAHSICPQVFDRALFGSFDEFDSLAERQRAMVFTEPIGRLAEYDVVIGHYDSRSLRVGRTHEDLVVLMREPRSRLISLFAYWRSWTEQEHASWGTYDASRHAVRLEWPDFLNDATIAPQIDNTVARLVLGHHPLVPHDGFINPADVPAVTLAALNELRRFGIVDVIENGESCWARLEEWVGLPLDVGNRNETPSAGGPPADWSRARDDDVEHALERRTVIDRQLWDAALLDSGALGSDQLADRAEEIYVAQLARVGVVDIATSPMSASRPAARAASALRRAARRLPTR